MNKKTFIDSVQKQLTSEEFDIPFLTGWYEKTIEILQSMSRQDQGIKHIRHRGDSREMTFKQLINSILPERYTIEKGFVVNKLTSRSLEQDSLIVDTSSCARFIRTREISYVPIESVAASIEIKSKLTTEELRKSLINAISLKKLIFEVTDFSNSDNLKGDTDVCYAIFAYTSTKSLEGMAKELNEYSLQIPDRLNLNMIYVLDKGLILPVDKKTGRMFIGAEITSTGRYGFYRSEKSKIQWYAEATPFLWFLANIIDFVSKESDKRKKPRYIDYIFAPVILNQQAIEAKEKNGTV
jgi:hypothetical protein